MANTLTTVIQMLLQPSLKTTAFGTLAPALSLTASLANGTAINQADLGCVVERTVVTGTPDVIDLVGGGLIGIDGLPFNPAKIVAIAGVNPSVTAAEILAIGGGASGFNTWLNGTTGLKIGPGGFIISFNPSLAAWGTTAGTGDLLPVTAASGTVTYRLGLIGRSV